MLGRIAEHPVNRVEELLPWRVANAPGVATGWTIGTVVKTVLTGRLRSVRHEGDLLREIQDDHALREARVDVDSLTCTIFGEPMRSECVTTLLSLNVVAHLPV